MTMHACAECGEFIRSERIAGCAHCAATFHERCVATCHPCSNCGGPLTLGEVPPLVAIFRLDRELRDAPTEDAQLDIVERRWETGEIAGGEYEFLLDAVHGEAHGAYSRELVLIDLRSGDRCRIRHALYDASSRDADTTWAEKTCVAYAASPDGAVQLAAVIALGHLAQRAELSGETLETVAGALSDGSALAEFDRLRVYVLRLRARKRPAN